MHLCVCICTYKRPDYLNRLLLEVSRQETENLFTYSAVVVDNDRKESARPIVAAFSQSNGMAVKYFVQERQNISLTRNLAVRNAEGDFIVFIDDDEFPITTWLLALFKACQHYHVDGVLGPVKPHYDEKPPGWVIKGKFYDRPSYPTGFVIDWRKGRTGNVLLKKDLFAGQDQPFNPDFLSGEDQDFFRRMIEKGHVFVWCHEAMAYESVPPIRWKLSFMLRRALLRGRVAAREPGSGPVDKIKSFVAIAVYAFALPFLLLAGFHLFISYLVKMFDHIGKVFGLLGIDLVKESYVTE